jgi:hypothetical protein
MIGLGTAPGGAQIAPFPPGSEPVLYTDGLVERRDRPFDEGVAGAATHLTTRPERRRCRVSGDARWRRSGESGIVEARRSSPAPGC